MLLPELISRLVKATVPKEQVTKCDFASEAETHRPGYDGTTVIEQRTLYVPEGISFWELGCESRPEKKAQEDYDKRVEEHLERIKAGESDDISKATFIVVTACDWHGKKPVKEKKKATAKKSAPPKSPHENKAPLAGIKEWTNAREKEKRFKAVIAYDSNQLEQWIREAPAVGLWLAKEMGKAIDGVLDVHSYWLDLLAGLKRPLPPEILLVNRSSIAGAFKDWQSGPAQELVVKAPSAFEVIAVFSAWVQTLSKEDANAVSSRAIIVEDRNAWRELVNSPHPLVLISSPRLDGDRELYSSAVRKGHYVLRHADTRSGNRTGLIELERMRRFDLQQALEKAGVEDVEARQIANGAGGNFTILRRIFSKSPEVQFPLWSKEPVLAAMLLAGAWEDERIADQEIIHRITRMSYENAREIAAKWRVGMEPDAPLRLITKERGQGKSWEFLSPFDAWEALRLNLNPSQMAIFDTIAIEVLSENDPALTLPPDDRPMAAIKGKVWKFSHDLRQGIAEILAIGACRQDEIGDLDLDFSQHASLIVRSVLVAKCGWERWASLGELLSSLAEAAPDEFLSATERDLDSPDSQIIELLRQEIPPSGIGGAAYHSGLLWALETAAWSREQFKRVALILGRITERDPGGKWANRPLGSTTRLFFSWRPQTVAPIGDRIETLKLLCRNVPAAGWKIILELIPSSGGIFMDSSKPVYRDWAAGWTGRITEKEYSKLLNAVVEESLLLTSAEPSRWEELLGHITQLYSISIDAYEKIRSQFSVAIKDGFSISLRERLWERVRTLVQEHTHFHDADWALPTGEINEWIKLRDFLIPDDLVIQTIHLFNDHGLEDPDEKLTYEQKQERLNIKRQKALREIWRTGGISEIVRLASEVNNTWPIGWLLAKEMTDEPFTKVVPEYLACGKQELENFSCGYSSQRINNLGTEWAKNLSKEGWSAAQIAAWSMQMPFSQETWAWVKNQSQEIEQLYWTGIGSWRTEGLSWEEVTFAIKNYQKVGRAWDALQFLVSRKDFKEPSNVDLLCSSLDAILNTPIGRQIGTMDAHYVREAFSYLQRSESGAEETRVATLEFAFLPLLDRHSLLPKMLHRQLAKNPQLFVDCLKALYKARKPDNEDEEEEGEEVKEPSQSKQEHASRVWHLLRDWQVIPGTNDEGILVPSVLNEWISTARDEARKVGRLVVADLQIGGVFAKSPIDSDEAIPLKPIRDVIENCKSEEMERGFGTGLHNLRGVYSKGLYEGGVQERELADSYTRYAEICAAWPRTAQALKSVAKDYLRQAAIEDDRAEARD